MKLSKALQAAEDRAKQHDSYWFERAKLDFAIMLEDRRRIAGLSYKALAENLNTSPAYVTKIFRGDANLTIESMVKLARAVGSQLAIDLTKTAAVKNAPRPRPAWDWLDPNSCGYDAANDPLSTGAAHLWIAVTGSHSGVLAEAA